MAKSSASCGWLLSEACVSCLLCGGVGKGCECAGGGWGEGEDMEGARDPAELEVVVRESGEDGPAAPGAAVGAPPPPP